MGIQTVSLSNWVCELPYVSKLFQIKRKYTLLLFSYSVMLLFSCSVMSNSVTPWTAAHQTSLSFTISWGLLNSRPWVIDVIQAFHSLLPPSPPALNLPALEYCPMRGPFALGGQSTGASALTSVLPMNIQGRFPVGLTALISLQSKAYSKSLLQHHNSKASVLWHSAFFIVQLSHCTWLDCKNHSFDYMDLCQQSDVSAF